MKVSKKLVQCFITDVKTIKIAAYESQYFKIIIVTVDFL